MPELLSRHPSQLIHLKQTTPTYTAESCQVSLSSCDFWLTDSFLFLSKSYLPQNPVFLRNNKQVLSIFLSFEFLCFRIMYCMSKRIVSQSCNYQMAPSLTLSHHTPSHREPVLDQAVIWMRSLGKCQFGSSVHFQLSHCFFAIGIRMSLVILDINCLQVTGLHMFSLALSYS